MFLAQRLIAAGLAVGIAGGFSPGAEPTKKEDASVALGVMQSMTAEAAKSKVDEWLRSTGKMDQSKFDSIWSKSERSVLDRTADSLALGVPGVAACLESARNSESTAPTSVPTEILNDKLEPFVRANIAAAYMKALASRRVYEEGLAAIQDVAPENVVEPGTFFFFKAVSEFGLGQRDAAMKSLIAMIDEVGDGPERYSVLARNMMLDVLRWSRDERDLGAIARLMDNSGRRLDLSRAGSETQVIQKKILFRLDEMIARLEHPSCSKCEHPSPPPTPPDPSDPMPYQPMPTIEPTPSTPINPTTPITPTDRPVFRPLETHGEIIDRKLRDFAGRWGTLPEMERAQVIQDITRELPARYRGMIESYFRSLNRVNGLSK